MIRTAVIGVGWAGQRQVEASRELGKKIEVTCLVDTDGEYLEVKAKELGVEKTAVDYADVLEDPEIDAVSICTPHRFHRDQAIAAAEAGKHVLVEKPIALTVADATQMIEAAAKAGVRLYVAESEVYTPIVRWLREQVISGEYTGQIVSASYLSGFRADLFRYPGRREWLTRPELGGTGTWTLHGIHSMAKIRRIFGEVESVYLTEHHAQDFATPEIEGSMTGVLTMCSGIAVTVLQTCESKIPNTWNGFRLYGTEGILSAAAEGFSAYSFTEGNAVGDRLLPYPTESLSPYAQELEAFADYIAGDVIGPTTAESERRTLAIIEAGYESAETGLPVPLSKYGDL